MTISISDSTSTLAAVAPTPHASSIHALHKTAAPDDTVNLSESQEVKLLVQQGDSVAEIATGLGVSTAIVESYLGVPAPIPASPSSPNLKPQIKTTSTTAMAGFTKG
jgi:hypothetical protein